MSWLVGLTPEAVESTFGALPTVTLADFPIGEAISRPVLAQSDCDCDCACTMTAVPSRAPLAAPVAYYLELTAVCPHQCVGCGNVFIDRGLVSQAPRPLNAKQWQSIIDKLQPSVSLIRLTGGEPTAHPEFFAIVDKLAANRIPFALLTSGRWPRPHALVEKLAGCPEFLGMLISLHGADEATHEAFTQAKGSFRAAVAAVRLAVARGIPVATSVVMVKANLGRLRSTAENALAIGANHVVFNRFIGLPGLRFTLTEAELRAAMREVKSMEDEGYPVRFGNCIPQCFEASTARGCSAGFSYCTIDPWGNVRPCNHTSWVAGNLLDDDLTMIWQSDIMQRWRNLQPDACHSCPAKAVCLGGCHAIALGRDPLMAGPERVPAPQSGVPAYMTLSFAATATPMFTTLANEVDTCLVREGRVLRLPSSTRPLLDDLFQSTRTLAQLEKEWGSIGLSIVAWLYHHHFLDLSYPAKPERAPRAL